MAKADISFHAAELLRETTLRHDHPDVWSRYIMNRFMYVTQDGNARVSIPLDTLDLQVLTDYLEKWLDKRSYEPSAWPYVSTELRYAVDATSELRRVIFRATRQGAEVGR